MRTLDEEITLAYDSHSDSVALLPAVECILAKRGVDEPRAAFERAGARDFLGLEGEAIPFYRQALDQGLTGSERLQCLVQLASSLRNVGDAESAVQILRRARDEASAEHERDWIDSFLALALHTHGQPAEALSVALSALAPHLTRYERTVLSYADELVDS